jgi:protein-S-isoprenylcysteine O-methyltransferase Ste14
MKLLTEWGFSRVGWRTGQRGEYWVVVQAVLMLGFVALPVYQPQLSLLSVIQSSVWRYGIWAIAAVLGGVAVVFLVKGLRDLGRSLTPLPYPREDGQLVRSGVYSIVRHPIYSGVILAAIAWTMFQFSLTHLVGTILFFLFFDAKSRQEEIWLSDRYPDYSTYQQQVKKLIPGIY